MTAPPPALDQWKCLGLLALLLTACSAEWADGPAGAPMPGEAGPGRFSEVIEVDGRRWSYAVHVSPRHDGEAPLPLVLLLHGASGTGTGLLDDAGWAALADREGLIVVAPDALPMQAGETPDRVMNPRIWNSGQHPPDRPRGRVDDLGFIDALLAEVAGRWRVDPSRIYAAGHSNGGAMALRLGAERSGVFAAVASVAGLRYVDPPPDARGVSILAIFGGADPLLPTEGGLSVLPWEIRRTPAILPEARSWAAGLGSPMRPVSFEHRGGVHRFSFPPGRDGATVSFMLLDGHGHAWPGSRPRPAEPLLIGPRTDAIDATEVVWAFLSPRRRPD